MALHLILPTPQSISLNSDQTILLGTTVTRLTNSIDPLVFAAEAYLKEHLMDAVCKPCTNPGVPVFLTLSDTPPGEMSNSEQGYTLVATQDRVTITGFGPAGLYYGVRTLVQALDHDAGRYTLPCVTITDWPALATRGHFMECRYGSNLMTLSDWKHVVDVLAEQKMNQLVVGVYGCWCVQYDGRISEYLYLPLPQYPKLQTPVVSRYYSVLQDTWVDREELPPMFRDDFFGELITYGKQNGVTVFPLFNSYGHNTLIPRLYPVVSARTADGAPTGHGFCVSCEETYEMLFAIYDHIIDTYLNPNGIDSFHIGMDEVRNEIATDVSDVHRIVPPWCECPVCEQHSKEENFLRHAVRLISHLKARGMKNIYIYQDMLVTMKIPDAFMTAMREADLLDVVVVDWWSYEDVKGMLMYQDLRPDLNLRSTIKPMNGYYHWNLLTDAMRNNALIFEIGIRDGAEGVQSYSAWDESYDRVHNCQSDYAWNFKGAGSLVDVTERYIKRNFAGKAQLARRAFALIDRLAEPNPVQAPGAWYSDSLQNFLFYECAYYVFSYVQTNKPYPRNFPGEPLTVLSANREQSIGRLNTIIALAGEAYDLFLQITEDSSCNVPMARRYAYEMGNYQCIAEDYLALLSMTDTKDVAAIRTLAEKRHSARLALMRLLETAKEPFLMAGHMRNQSIFLQLFDDLTKITDLPDFSDLSSIASERFWALR